MYCLPTLFRDMEKAHSILKDCGEFIGQAASTVPRSMTIAQSGRGSGATSGPEGILVPSGDQEESMEVSDTSGSKARLILLPCRGMNSILCLCTGYWGW